VMDRKWREHLYEMDYLQEGIGLRAMGQRDPLVEYQREGFDMFASMMEAIKEESVGFLFNVEVQVEEHPPAQDVIASGPGEHGELLVEHLSLPGAEPAPGPAMPLPGPTGGQGSAPPAGSVLTSLPGSEPTAPEDVPPAPASARYGRVLDDGGTQPLLGAGSGTPFAGQTAPAADFGPELVAPEPAPVEPVGVAGEPVPSAAPAAFVDEASLTLEHPELPTAVAAEPAGSAPSAAGGPDPGSGRADLGAPEPAAPAPVAPEPVPAEPAAPVPPATAPQARTVLPESFGRRDRGDGLRYSAPNAEGGVATSGGPATADRLTGQVTSGQEQSRNAPCHCGSGKKYKRCHGDPRHS